jgi:uncharacterized protein YqeY
MNTLKEQIQDRIKQCMKDGNAFERDTLRTVLGEAQSKNLNATDEDIVKTLKKTKQGCVDNLKYMQEPQISEVNKEIEIYDKYLPKTLSLYEIIDRLATDEIIKEIIGAKSDGQATGVAMGFFKKNGFAVDGKDVTVSIKQIRST